jgi:hypothetical protein
MPDPPFGQVNRGSAADGAARVSEYSELGSSTDFSTDETQLVGILDSSSRRSSIFALEDSAHVRVCVRVRPMRGQVYPPPILLAAPVSWYPLVCTQVSLPTRRFGAFAPSSKPSAGVVT